MLHILSKGILVNTDTKGTVTNKKMARMENRVTPGKCLEHAGNAMLGLCTYTCYFKQSPLETGKNDITSKN